MAAVARIPDPLLNEQQAAAILTLKPGTLQVWRSTKKVEIPYVKIGRAVRYRQSDVEAFLAAQTVSPKPSPV